MSQTQASELAREIAQLFQEQEEVILDTNDIQQFLSRDRIVDSVEAMEIIREICDQHHWDSFVYDYGALVRFTRRSPDLTKAERQTGGEAAINS